MAKEAQDQFEDPAAVDARRAEGCLDHSASWERRLQEARLLREKLLAEHATGARSVANPEGGTEHSSVSELSEKSDRNSSKPEGRAARPTGPTDRVWYLPKQTASKGVLVFAAAAGLGFGTVLGIGVVLDVGTWTFRESDVPDAPYLSRNDRSEASELAASIETLETGNRPEVVAAGIAPRRATDGLAVDPEPLPFGDSPEAAAPTLVPPGAQPAQLEMADLTSVARLAPPELPVSPVPAGPDDLALLRREVTEAGQGEDKRSVFMHVPDGVSRTTLRGYLDRLDDAGVNVAEIGRERFRVSATHVRYYSRDNAALAKTIAADLGAEARDFSRAASNSSRIEIWIAGRPRGRSVETVAAAERSGRAIVQRDKLSANR